MLSVVSAYAHVCIHDGHTGLLLDSWLSVSVYVCLWITAHVYLYVGILCLLLTTGCTGRYIPNRFRTVSQMAVTTVLHVEIRACPTDMQLCSQTDQAHFPNHPAKTQQETLYLPVTTHD